MNVGVTSFRDSFASQALRETLRAFLIFTFLTLALVTIGGQLAFRGLSLGVLREKIDLGRITALEISDQVSRLGQRAGAIDYAALRGETARIRDLIQGRIEQTPFVRSVEVRDRFGVRIILVARGEPSGTPGGSDLAGDSRQRLIRVALAGDGSRSEEGQVLLAISPTAVEQELLDLQRSLWIKIAVAGLLAVGVLVLGLFYVLHLLRKNRRLERARQAAERASYVGLLASGLAHEIRNPLNAMNMNLQMLEEELQGSGAPVEEEHAEMLASTKSEIKRLEQLVSSFLTYARPTSPRLEPADLNGLARDVMRLLDADFKQHGVELIDQLDPALPEAEIDATQLKQALINLLVNARQVLREGGRVVVRSRSAERETVTLEIVDDGPGIPDEAREKIFEVFYSSRGGGTGLGLPIAKQIVEGHGGAIEVESAVGEGTVFRIRLRSSRAQTAVPAPATEHPA
jgi:signal transduction histidine kinase